MSTVEKIFNQPFICYKNPRKLYEVTKKVFVSRLRTCNVDVLAIKNKASQFRQFVLGVVVLRDLASELPNNIQECMAPVLHRGACSPKKLFY